jgi:DNA-binding MarR family transcriptional regulator
MMETEELTPHDVARSCACLRVRKAARVVTRAYDEALRPLRLKATQFSVLVAASVGEGLSISALADALDMERTTLTRNLGPLVRDGLVAVKAEGARRARAVTITAKGRAHLQQALPLWRDAQDALRRRLGREKWADIRSRLDDLIAAA